MKHFSDFAEEPAPLDGDKVRLDDILNKEFQVTGYRIKNSRYSRNESGKYLTLQFLLNGQRLILFTGSEVLIGQVEQYCSEIPFLTIIKQINRYYTLT